MIFQDVSPRPRANEHLRLVRQRGFDSCMVLNLRLPPVVLDQIRACVLGRAFEALDSVRDTCRQSKMIKKSLNEDSEAYRIVHLPRELRELRDVWLQLSLSMQFLTESCLWKPRVCRSRSAFCIVHGCQEQVQLPLRRLM